ARSLRAIGLHAPVAGVFFLAQAAFKMESPTMLLPSWLPSRKSLSQRVRSRPRRRSPDRQGRGRFRPGLELLEPRTLLTTLPWINPSSGDWDTPGNWDAGRVPNSSDDVVINTAGITVSHSSSVADSVKSLTSQAALTLAAGSLSITNPSSINNNFTLSGGTL